MPLDLPDHPLVSVFSAVALAIAITVFLWALVVTIRAPRSEWERIGESRATWLALQLMLPVLAAVLFLNTVRPRLLGRELPREKGPGLRG